MAGSPINSPPYPSEDPSTSCGRVDVALIAVFRRTCERIEVLVARRKPDAIILPNEWEFPGGKIEHGETPLQAAARELCEEVQIECNDRSPAWREIARITPPPAQGRPAVQFFLFLLELPPNEQPRAMAADALAWVELSALAELEWPETNREVVNAITIELSRFE